jgi:hypothetical protein
MRFTIYGELRALRSSHRFYPAKHVQRKSKVQTPRKPRPNGKPRPSPRKPAAKGGAR